jgi:hypothetical protein
MLKKICFDIIPIPYNSYSLHKILECNSIIGLQIISDISVLNYKFLSFLREKNLNIDENCIGIINAPNGFFIPTYNNGDKNNSNHIMLMIPITGTVSVSRIELDLEKYTPVNLENEARYKRTTYLETNGVECETITVNVGEAGVWNLKTTKISKSSGGVFLNLVVTENFSSEEEFISLINS